MYTAFSREATSITVFDRLTTESTGKSDELGEIGMSDAARLAISKAWSRGWRARRSGRRVGFKSEEGKKCAFVCVCDNVSEGDECIAIQSERRRSGTEWAYLIELGMRGRGVFVRGVFESEGDGNEGRSSDER